MGGKHAHSVPNDLESIDLVHGSILTWHVECSFSVKIHDYNGWMIPTCHTRVFMLVICECLKMEIGMRYCFSWRKLFPYGELQTLNHSSNSSVDLWFNIKQKMIIAMQSTTVFLHKVTVYLFLITLPVACFEYAGIRGGQGWHYH